MCSCIQPVASQMSHQPEFIGHCHPNVTLTVGIKNQRSVLVDSETDILNTQAARREDANLRLWP